MVAVVSVLIAIFRTSFDKKGNVIGNDKVEKVSEAVKGDTVFMSKSAIEDATFIDKVNVILAKQGLALVISQAKECKNGSYRTFIGDANYKPFETVLE